MRTNLRKVENQDFSLDAITVIRKPLHREERSKHAPPCIKSVVENIL